MVPPGRCSPRFASPLLAATACALVAFVARNAFAQEASPAPTLPPPVPSIEVADPLLAPVPPPAHRIAGWREALTLIQARSPDLQVALQEVERAHGLSRQALGRALTTITARGTLTHNIFNQPITSNVGGGQFAFVPPATTATAQIVATQPVIAPRTWYAIGTAHHAIDLAKLQLVDARRTVLASVADAIVGVVTAERVAEINRVGLRSALERLELTRRRARLGTGTALDVVRSEQDVTAARAMIVTGDESLRQAREALGMALGSSEPFGVEPGISLNDLEATLRRACTVASPEDRADVKAAREARTIAERRVTEAKLGFAPFVDLSTTATYSNQTIAGGRPYAWSISGVLTIPIWDGGSRYGEIRTAKAEVLQQEARLDQVQRTAVIEARQATRGIEVAEAGRRQAARARDLARETARLVQVAFEVGTATSFELVDAGRRLREAELDLAVREFELVQAQLAALLAAANCTF